MSGSLVHRLGARAGVVALAAAAALLGAAPAAPAADTPVPGSLSDVRVTDTQVTATLSLRGAQKLAVDPGSVEVTIGGADAKTETGGAERSRSTMIVIDTSGSMGTAGMATVRSAVASFLAAAPKDVKVGVVSFASTAGVDVAPTTNRALVTKEVRGLTAQGETSLYAAMQVAVAGLGTDGERSILLISDGGDTVAALKGGAAAEKTERLKALSALKSGKVRAEVVAFKSAESNGAVLQQFANAGGGSVLGAGDQTAVAKAFTAAAVALDSQATLTMTRPGGVKDVQNIVVTGTAGGQKFVASSYVDLGDTAPVAVPTASAEPLVTPQQVTDSLAPLTSVAPAFLYPAIAVIVLGVFGLVLAFAAPVFRSKRSERVEAIDVYGFGRGAPQQRVSSSPSAIGEQLVSMGERVMEGRDSTTKTMQLLDRADLPWRAGEWFVLRIISVVVLMTALALVWADHPFIGALIGFVVGLLVPPFGLRFLAKRRSRKFEEVLPDVLMLVATSLASGFSLLQALDSVAKDAAEPAAKEFSRALAEARIGADVSDALDHMAQRMESDNMRWTTMAIRIQREVGGNLAETLRTTAATLREREMLRRQVRALSAEGRLSAYVLVGLPVGLLLYTTMVNYDYVSLLWTDPFGWAMSAAGIIAMVLGIFWMRKIVTIEV